MHGRMARAFRKYGLIDHMDAERLGGRPFLHIRQERWRGGRHWATLFILNQLGEWDPVCYLYEVPGSEDDLSLFYRGKTRLHEGTYQVRVLARGPMTWGLELYRPGSREIIPIQQVSDSHPQDACLMLVDFGDFDCGGPVKYNKATHARSRALMARLRIRYSTLGIGIREAPQVEVASTQPIRKPPAF
jgi:hypothetical protein